MRSIADSCPVVERKAMPQLSWAIADPLPKLVAEGEGDGPSSMEGWDRKFPRLEDGKRYFLLERSREGEIMDNEGHAVLFDFNRDTLAFFNADRTGAE